MAMHGSQPSGISALNDTSIRSWMLYMPIRSPVDAPSSAASRLARGPAGAMYSSVIAVSSKWLS